MLSVFCPQLQSRSSLSSSKGQPEEILKFCTDPGYQQVFPKLERQHSK